jgi:glycosyltransferase involved in cell wall biosynthesis
VFEIHDIWPESIRAVDAMRNGLLLRSLEFLERRLYRAADHIVTVGNGYRERVLEKFDHPDRISVITNGVDLRQFEQTEPDGEFCRRWGLQGKFVCSYIGTIGMAHGLDVVLQAAQIFREQGQAGVKFLLVGDGAQRERLQVEAQDSGLEDLIVFTGRLARNEMPQVLANSDACLIHLRGCELFGSVIPSKMFEIMAMQRPIIMGVRGEACDMVLESGAGIEMEPDSAESLVACINRLRDTPGLTQQLGSKAREYVAENFSRDVLAGRFLTRLESLAGKTVTPPTSSPAAEESPTRVTHP